MTRARQFLDYVASQEDAVLTYRASDMVLAAHSDAGYLNETNARSRAGGHIFLSSNTQYPQNNGAILNVAQIIKHVMSSATEAELAALYIVAKQCVYIRLILEETGHAQPETPIQTDNLTTEGVINSKIQPKRMKAMDMRFHWLRDREAQHQFRFYWRSGKTMLADYYSKHHPAAHHRNMRGEYHTTQAVLNECRARTDCAAAKVIQANLVSIKKSADLAVHNKIKTQLELEHPLIRALMQESAQQDAEIRALRAVIRANSA